MPAILTTLGLQKIANATPLDQLTIQNAAVGSGVNPLDPASTALVNEEFRTLASTPVRDSVNPNTLIFEINVPPTTGGFTIREIGIFDDEGDMIAVGTLDEVVKPTDGINYTGRIHVALSNASDVDVFYDNQGAIDHGGLRNRDAEGAHPSSAISFKLSTSARTVTRAIKGKSATTVDVKDFGAIGDGSYHPLSERFPSLMAAQVVYPEATALTDSIDWAAAQSAVNYLSRTIERKAGVNVTAKTGAVYFPQNERFNPDGTDATYDYVFNRQLTVREGYYIELNGDGPAASRIRQFNWIDTTESLIEFVDCTRPRLDKIGFLVVPNPLNPTQTIMDSVVSVVQDSSTSTVNATTFINSDVEILGSGAVQQLIDVRFEGADITNDFNKFIRFRGRGYKNAAVRLAGTQAHLNHFEDIDINGLNEAETDRIGTYGILSVRNPATGRAPSIVVDGGNGVGHHTAADFYLEGGSQGATIKGISSEGSTRFLDTDQLENSLSVTLENCRYSSENLAPDGYFIRHRLGGSLKIISGEYGTNGVDSDSIPKILLHSDTEFTANISGGTRIVWARNTGDDNITRHPIIETQGAQNGYFDVSITELNQNNRVATTRQDYLEKTDTDDTDILNAYQGNVDYSVNFNAVRNIRGMRAMYNGQVVRLIFRNSNATLIHNSSGPLDAGKFILKGGADLPTNTLDSLFFYYDMNNNRWLEQ